MPAIVAIDTCSASPATGFGMTIRSTRTAANSTIGSVIGRAGTSLINPSAASRFGNLGDDSSFKTSSDTNNSCPLASFSHQFRLVPRRNTSANETGFEIDTGHSSSILSYGETNREKHPCNSYDLGVAMHTFLGSVKKRRASWPPSRPTPLCFIPPKGTRRSRSSQQFTQIVPA